MNGSLLATKYKSLFIRTQNEFYSNANAGDAGKYVFCSKSKKCILIGSLGVKNGDYDITLAIRLVFGMGIFLFSIIMYGVSVDMPLILVISLIRYFIEYVDQRDCVVYLYRGRWRWRSFFNIFILVLRNLYYYYFMLIYLNFSFGLIICHCQFF